MKMAEPASARGWPALAGNRTSTSAWKVQLPRSETWVMPSTVCVNTLGSAVGARVQVVPALTRMSAALVELVVKTKAAQASARPILLNRLNFVILFFPFCFSGVLHLSLVNCFYLSVRRGWLIWAKHRS